MKIQFAAGFGPIIRDRDASLRFYRDMLGLPIPEGDYLATNDIDGIKHFGLWSLEDAAEAIFGKREWPSDLPVPQSSIEFDLESPETLEGAADELRRNGVRILVGPKEEPWGQTVLRFLSPEGMLVGLTYTPWMH